MHHKGYTYNYFINFFKGIPNSRWTTGKVRNANSGQFCALGHAIVGQNPSKNKLANFDGKNAPYSVRSFVLNIMLDCQVEKINDARPGSRYYRLGKTPRTRILRALRNRKRYGNVMGKL